MKASQWRRLLEAVVREAERDKRFLNRQRPDVWAGIENAPGHAHDVKGIWDSDNGAIAGTECSWCLAWNAAREALAREVQS